MKCGSANTNRAHDADSRNDHFTIKHNQVPSSRGLRKIRLSGKAEAKQKSNSTTLPKVGCFADGRRRSLTYIVTSSRKTVTPFDLAIFVGQFNIPRFKRM
jgi:hypothetical protein